MVRKKDRSMIEILMNFPFWIQVECCSRLVLLLFCEDFGLRMILEFLKGLLVDKFLEEVVGVRFIAPMWASINWTFCNYHIGLILLY